MDQQVQQKKKVDFDLSQFSGDDRAEMAAMYEETLKNFTEGSIVSGKVLEVRKDEVLIDIGYKSEGVVPAGEFVRINIVVLSCTWITKATGRRLDECTLFEQYI